MCPYVCTQMYTYLTEAHMQPGCASQGVPASLEVKSTDVQHWLISSRLLQVTNVMSLIAELGRVRRTGFHELEQASCSTL